MRKSRLIFYAMFGAFHIAAFIFTILIEDFSFLSSIFGYISYFKYVAFLGILLILTDIVWAFVAYRNSEKEKNSLTNELTMLKARLFDLQEAAKTNLSPAADTNKDQ